MQTTFAERFRTRERLLGTFIKTPTSHACEILGGIGLDFVIIDQEHAPIGRSQLDQMLLGCKTSGLAGLVRVPALGDVLCALDTGATGVLVPHVSDVARAREFVAVARYSGERGFSNTNRAGAYGGHGMHEHILQQDRDTVTIAMIEDKAAIANIEAILTVDGLDGIFIGQGDLTVSMRADSPRAPEVRDAVARVLAAARQTGKPICIMVADAEGAKAFEAAGANAFVVSNDQSLMRTAALRLVDEFKAMPAAGEH